MPGWSWVTVSRRPSRSFFRGSRQQSSSVHYSATGADALSEADQLLTLPPEVLRDLGHDEPIPGRLAEIAKLTPLVRQGEKSVRATILSITSFTLLLHSLST